MRPDFRFWLLAVLIFQHPVIVAKAQVFVPTWLSLTSETKADGPSGVRIDFGEFIPAKVNGNYAVDSLAEGFQMIDGLLEGTASGGRIESTVAPVSVSFSTSVDFSHGTPRGFNSSAVTDGFLEFEIGSKANIEINIDGTGTHRFLEFVLRDESKDEVVRVEVLESDFGILMNNEFVEEEIPYQTHLTVPSGFYTLSFAHFSQPVEESGGMSTASLRVGIIGFGDFDRDGVLHASDIDALSAAVAAGSVDGQFDVDQDGRVRDSDRQFWVENLAGTYFGDANLDGEFNSADLIAVFTVAQYEDGIPGNSMWSDGDWNGDTEFNSSDLVVAFQSGGFELGRRKTGHGVPEPGGGLLAGMVCVIFAAHRTRLKKQSSRAPHSCSFGSTTRLNRCSART